MADATLPYKNLSLIPDHALSAICVDLLRIQNNYRVLQAFLKSSGSSQTRCGAVVKANAYGLGVTQVAQALFETGCTEFFVADCGEALHVRPYLPKGKVRLYVFSGLTPKTESLFIENDLIPVLLHREQVLAWQEEAVRQGRKLPAALHVDTGMSRTGLSEKDVAWLLETKEILEAFELDFVMSHLACSCDRSAVFNERQRQRFVQFLSHFPGVSGSFVASEGILFGKDYHFDVVRPGKFLFGLGEHDLPGLEPVVRIYGRILEIMDVEPGQSVGYEGTYTFERQGRVAAVAIGYADGLPRSLGNRGCVKVHGKSAPIVGRVSMDCISVDITDIEGGAPGDWVTLVDDEITLDSIAKYTGTISREISCRLGARPSRLYVKGEVHALYPPFGLCGP